MFRTVTALFLSLFIFSFSLAASEKLVYINVQKIINESLAGKDAQKVLEEAAKKAQAMLEAKAKTIPKTDQKAQQELQMLAAQKQQEILQKRQEIADKFMKIVQDSLNRFAKQRGYLLVVDKQTVLYGKPQLDKTEEFLAYFNAQYKKGPKIK